LSFQINDAQYLKFCSHNQWSSSKKSIVCKFAMKIEVLHFLLSFNIQ
jgi:hypothetical protein